MYCASYHVKGYRVTRADEFSDILHECFYTSKDGVKLVEVRLKLSNTFHYSKFSQLFKTDDQILKETSLPL